MDTIKPIQRRQNERHPTQLAVEFRGQSGQVAAQLADIGVGGMCLKTTESLSLHSKAFFRILPFAATSASLQYHLEAEVVWVEVSKSRKTPRRIGLKFITSRFITSEMLAGLVTQLTHSSKDLD